MLIILLNRKEKYTSPKAGAPMSVDCDSNCGAFRNNPTDYNLNTDFGPGACSTCLTDYGESTLPCDYVNNYAGTLSASNFCDAMSHVKKNCSDSLTLDSWGYAAGNKCG